MTDIVSFWTGGPLTPYEQLALRSFARRGHSVKLYTYEADLQAPSGVELRDARDVLALSGLGEDLIEARAFALLSDVIRYRLLKDGTVGTTWIDTDVLLLTNDLPNSTYLFAFENKKWLNGAILRVPPDSRLASELIAATDGITAQSALAQPYGTFGPRLITESVRRLQLEGSALPSDSLYPINFQQIWRVFDAASFDWCRTATSNAFALHLWNAVISTAGFAGRAPQNGSFLHQLFVDNTVQPDGEPLTSGELHDWARRSDPTMFPLGQRLRRQAKKAKKQFRKKILSRVLRHP